VITFSNPCGLTPRLEIRLCICNSLGETSVVKVDVGSPSVLLKARDIWCLGLEKMNRLYNGVLERQRHTRRMKPPPFAKSPTDVAAMFKTMTMVTEVEAQQSSAHLAELKKAGTRSGTD